MVSVITRAADGKVSLDHDGPISVYGLPLGNLHYYFAKARIVGLWPRVIKAFEWSSAIRSFVRVLHARGEADVVVYSNVWNDALLHPTNIPYAVRMDTPLFTARLVAGCGDQRGWKAYEWLEQRTVKKADLIFCLTPSEVEPIQQAYKIGAQTIVAVCNPVDTNLFRPQPRLPTCRPRIFHPGPRLDDWQKGTHILLAAMETVLLKFPDAQLVLAGKGVPDLSRVNKNVAQSVQSLGWLGPDQLAAQYAAADVTIVPSLNYEAFSLVAAESLAAGTPVIGTSVGGLRDLIQHSQAGLIVEPGAVAELSEAIITALSNGKLVQQMRSSGRRFAEAQFSFEAVGGQMSVLLKRLVSERSGTRSLEQRVAGSYQ